MQNLGRDVSEIAAMLIGVAFVALLINRASDSAMLIKTTAESFGSLLGIVTLQNGYGNFAMQNRL